MADAATRLLALQNEREYLLFRLRDLQSREGDGLHPTGEQRKLMLFFEQLNAKIRELVDEVMAEGEEVFVARSGEVKEVIEGRMLNGVLEDSDGRLIMREGDHSIVLIFLKDE